MSECGARSVWQTVQGVQYRFTTITDSVCHPKSMSLWYTPDILDSFWTQVNTVTWASWNIEVRCLNDRTQRGSKWKDASLTILKGVLKDGNVCFLLNELELEGVFGFLTRMTVVCCKAGTLQRWLYSYVLLSYVTGNSLYNFIPYRATEIVMQLKKQVTCVLHIVCIRIELLCS